MNRIIPYLKKNFSGRKILICKEMTKYYENFKRLEIDKLDSLNIELKGELTLVISEKKLEKKNAQKLSESDKRMINKMINKLSVKEIVSLVSQKNKISKKEIYKYCVEKKNEH